MVEVGGWELGPWVPCGRRDHVTQQELRHEAASIEELLYQQLCTIATRFEYVTGVMAQVAAVATLQDDPQAVAARDLMQMGKMPTAEAIKAETKFDLHAELQKVSTSEECLVACRRPLVPLSPRV